MKVLLAVEGAELIGQVVLAVGRTPAGESLTALTPVVALISTSKWVLIVGLLVVGVGGLCVARQPVGLRLRQLRTAVWIQRFSVVAFAPIAVLAVVPAERLSMGVLAQVPDVQRAWLDDRVGIGHAAWAVVIYVVGVLPALFLLGRIRADWATRREAGGTWWPFFDASGGRPRRQRLLLWVAGPAVLLVVAGLSTVTGTGSVSWTRWVGFCFVPVMVMVASVLIHRLGWARPAQLADRVTPFARDTLAVGDILSVAALSLSGLGMVRAFMPVWALDAVGLLSYEVTISPLVGLAAAVALAIVPWLVSTSVLTGLAKVGTHAADKNVTAPQEAAGPVWVESRQAVAHRTTSMLRPGLNQRRQMPVPPDARVSLRMVLLTVSVLAFGLLASHPRWLADTVGVLAALTLALVALMVMLGVTVSYAQDRQPPELFQVRRLRLKATPIIGLLLLALLVTELIGKPTDIHAIRGTGTIPDRPTLSAAFAHWLRQDSCTVPLTGFPGLNLRPMLMYGAEGGGIRATYWTASVLGEIGAAGDGCARSAALFSAGASGGALGLTVGRFDPAPLDAVKEMAGPTRLAERP